VVPSFSPVPSPLPPLSQGGNYDCVHVASRKEGERKHQPTSSEKLKHLEGGRRLCVASRYCLMKAMMSLPSHRAFLSGSFLQASSGKRGEVGLCEGGCSGLIVLRGITAPVVGQIGIWLSSIIVRRSHIPSCIGILGQ